MTAPLRVVALVLAVTAIFVGAWLVIVAGLVWLGASVLARRRHRRAALHEMRARDAMQGHIDTVTADESLDAVSTRLVALGLDELPIVDHGHAVGVITREDVATGIRTVGPDAAVASGPHHDALEVELDDPLDTVIDRLAHAPRAVAVVVDHGTPVGVVSPDRLARYVTLHGR